MTNKTQLLAIAQKYLQGTASEEEIRILHDWYDSADEEEIEMVFTSRQESEQEVGNRIFATLQEKLQRRQPRIPLYKWVAAASVLIILLAAGGFWLTRRTPQKTAAVQVTPAPKKIQDVPPGGDKAKLVLADGTVIILEDVKDGAIRKESGITISKQNGRLVYDASHNTSSAPVSINTISTPRGGQYQVVLPDGTKVWLNASSSLQFPTTFSDTGRKVTLTGEAYFEVAAKKIPFNVEVGATEVQVLGTSFNINAYNDEPVIATTLLEGKVKVVNRQSAIGSGSAIGNRQSAVLDPGQQAVITHDSRLTTHVVDLDEAIAWKNGLFIFNSTDIHTIMRQIARWYDIDIRYEGKIPARTFTGEISRNINVSGVLKLLETGGVHFRLEGPLQPAQTPKIVVLP